MHERGSTRETCISPDPAARASARRGDQPAAGLSALGHAFVVGDNLSDNLSDGRPELTSAREMNRVQGSQRGRLYAPRLAENMVFDAHELDAPQHLLGTRQSLWTAGHERSSHFGSCQRAADKRLMARQVATQRRRLGLSHCVLDDRSALIASEPSERRGWKLSSSRHGHRLG